MAAGIIQLYCRALDITVDNYMITPSQNFKEIMTDIRAAFNLTFRLVVRDRKGNLLKSFSEVKIGDRLLVYRDKYENVVVEEYYYELYLGEKLTKNWLEFSPVERRKHIEFLQHPEKEPIHNILRITMPYKHVTACLAAFRKTPVESLSAKKALTVMRFNWNMNFEQQYNTFTLRYKPAGEPDIWEKEVYSALAILSECTIGSPHITRKLVTDAVDERV
ncbi:hypothetical protein K458DRAFT_399384 [Lentithecium fluviatile CBS 122367]|uniref:Uncharacterized protein n=1 Tax=Lentithecium fluviatile CBS 122367 TaxID=1168545 RepID=A0A6G1JHQ9_9PLEO|nr:hypothetical protein K458DRAFT_399384 [Lentithecium fluviatile CBS 122367]